MREMAGQVGVVTGAASGIGRGIATQFAREGMKLVVADVDEAGLAETARIVEEVGAEVLPVRTDVTSRAAVENLAAAALDGFGAVFFILTHPEIAHSGMQKRLEWMRSGTVPGGYLG